MKSSFILAAFLLSLSLASVNAGDYYFNYGPVQCDPNHGDPYYNYCDIDPTGASDAWIDITQTGTVDYTSNALFNVLTFDVNMAYDVVPAGNWHMDSDSILRADGQYSSLTAAYPAYIIDGSARYYQCFGAAPTRYCVFSWINIQHYSGSVFSSQIQIYEEGRIVMLLKDLYYNGGGYTLVGLEHYGSDTLQDWPMAYAPAGNYDGYKFTFSNQPIDVITTNAPSMLAIGNIESFDADVCSPAVMLSDGLSGESVSFDTFDMSGCTVYSDSTCNTEVTSVELAADGSATIYLICAPSYYQKLQANNVYSNVFQVVGHNNGGNICGDPHFIGYDGREFMFDGVIGEYYNVFTSPYVSINSLIKSANNANPFVKGTVNGAMGVRTFDFNMTLNPQDYDDTKKTIMFEFNGQKMWIAEDQELMMNGGCVLVRFEKDVNTRHHHHTFEVTTHKFKLYAYVSKDSNKYINTEYLDYFISALGKSDASTLGGIIGDTAGVYNPSTISDHPENYHMHSALDAGEKYQDKPLCRSAPKVIQKRQIDSPNCQTLANGYQCYKHRTCASGYCGRTHVCQPWDGCLSTSDCADASAACVDGHCVMQN